MMGLFQLVFINDRLNLLYADVSVLMGHEAREECCEWSHHSTSFFLLLCAKTMSQFVCFINKADKVRDEGVLVTTNVFFSSVHSLTLLSLAEKHEFV
jgi:hypothetical protein